MQLKKVEEAEAVFDRLIRQNDDFEQLEESEEIPIRARLVGSVRGLGQSLDRLCAPVQCV